MEVDTATGAGEEPVQQQQIALNILQTIRPVQQQNGLKHGDYGRYR